MRDTTPSPYRQLDGLIARGLMGWDYVPGNPLTWGVPGAERIRHYSWSPTTRGKDMQDVIDRLYGRDLTCVQMDNAGDEPSIWTVQLWGPEVQRRAGSKATSHVRATADSMGLALCRAIVKGYKLEGLTPEKED
jgi:hypothetical protein